MGFFSSLFGKNKMSKAPLSEHEGYKLEYNEHIQLDVVDNAINSDNLNEMLKVVRYKTTPITRHFLLQTIVQKTYKLRQDNKYLELCIKYSELHLNEFPEIEPELTKDNDGVTPYVSTFKLYATVLTEIGEYDKAISVCEQAIKYDIYDNMKLGFQGRIASIRRKAEKNNKL